MDCCFCVVKGWILGLPGDKGAKVHSEEGGARKSSEWKMGVGLSSQLGIGLSSPAGKWTNEPRGALDY